MVFSKKLFINDEGTKYTIKPQQEKWSEEKKSRKICGWLDVKISFIDCFQQVIFVVYFDQLSGDAHTQKLVKILFQPFFAHFKPFL